eukprot:scaffold10537_cov64-Phaeocystis_antarctica.AAC.2
MEPASEVAAASKAAATTAAASEVAAPPPALEPAMATAALEPKLCRAAASSAVVKSNSYAAAVSKPPVGPKFSAAASQLSADLKRPSAASKPAVAVLTPLEVEILFAPHQEPDDLTVARNTPLPEDIIGLAGDTVREPPYIPSRSRSAPTSPQFMQPRSAFQAAPTSVSPHALP